MKSNASVHWITATLPIGPEDPRILIQRWAWIIEKCTVLEVCKPVPSNYTDALKARLGTFSWHRDRYDMRICYNVTGSALELGTEANLKPINMIDALRSLNARFTRLDLALDYPDRVDLGEIVEAAKAHPDSTKARSLIPYKFVDIDGKIEEVVTGVYVGSTRSDRFLCCYDKGRELQLSELMLTRIEARNRKLKAQQAANLVGENTLSTATRSIIKQFADFPLQWWQNALTGPIEEVEPVGRKQTDTTKWLIDIVAPVLAREIKEQGGMNSTVYQVFAKVIIDHTRVDQ